MRKQVGTPKVREFYGKIREAFKGLRKQGIAARMDFKCCMSCACYAAPDKPFVYFHHQDKERLFEYGEELMIRYCTPNAGGIGTLADSVCDALRKAGITVDWDGYMGTCIAALVSQPQ